MEQCRPGQALGPPAPPSGHWDEVSTPPPHWAPGSLPAPRLHGGNAPGGGLLGGPPEALSTRPRLLTLGLAQASHGGDGTRLQPGQDGDRVRAWQWVRNKGRGRGLRLKTQNQHPRSPQGLPLPAF